jgi:ribosome biogenesis GTPase
VNELKTLYEKINYKVFVVSALNESTLDELKSELKNRVTLFSGHSGVGKSSIVNSLIPELKLKVSPISNTHQTGIHTTTFAEMHELPSGGYIIDTPGIREFGTIDFDRFEVSHFFPDIFSVSKNCKYNNCIHLNETECAVLDAIEKGEIALSRYQSYLSILNNEDYFN